MIIKFKKVLYAGDVILHPITVYDHVRRIIIPQKKKNIFYYHCEFYPSYSCCLSYLKKYKWFLEGKEFAEI